MKIAKTVLAILFFVICVALIVIAAAAPPQGSGALLLAGFVFCFLGWMAAIASLEEND